MHVVYFTCILLTTLFLQRSVKTTGLIDANIDTAAISKQALVGRYTIYRKRMTWGEAHTYCEKHEGNLATFPEAEDAKSVVEKIFDISEKVSDDFLHGKSKAEFGLNRRYWIGLTDLVTGEGNWVWVGKGKPLKYITMWYPGQPDHIDDKGRYIGRPEHCGALWNPVFHKGDRRHSFADVECDLKYYFICEKDQDKIDIQNSWRNKGGGMGRGIFVPRERVKTRKVSALGRSVPSAPSAVIHGWEANDVDAKKQFVRKMKNSLGFSELFQDSSSSEIRIKRKRHGA